MFGRAFVDDDLPHLAVIQHMVDVVVARQQWLQAEMEFSVDLNRLWRGFFLFKNAQVGVKAQTGQCQYLSALGSQHGVCARARGV